VTLMGPPIHLAVPVDGVFVQDLHYYLPRIMAPRMTMSRYDHLTVLKSSDISVPQYCHAVGYHGTGEEDDGNDVPGTGGHGDPPG